MLAHPALRVDRLEANTNRLLLARAAKLDAPSNSARQWVMGRIDALLDERNRLTKERV